MKHACLIYSNENDPVSNPDLAVDPEDVVRFGGSP